MSTYINILNGKKNTNRLDYSKKNQALQLQCQLNKPKGLKIKRSTHETNGCRYSTVQCQHFGCTVPKYCSGIAAFYIAQQVLAHLFLFHKLLGSWPAINSLHELGLWHIFSLLHGLDFKAHNQKYALTTKAVLLDTDNQLLQSSF